MDKQKKNLLVFGYGLCIILGFFATRLWFKHGFVPVHAVFGSGILVFLFLTIFRRDILLIIYNRWMKVAGKIGHVVSTLVLCLLFYGMFAPVGLILRLLKKDLLNQRLDTKISSYWIKKVQEPFSKERYQQQF